MQFDPMKALMRFLNSRPEREAELMEACSRYLERARIADRRLVCAYDALERIAAATANDGGAPQLTAIFEIAQDALADRTQAISAVEMGAEFLVNACHGAALRAGWWTDLHTGESLIGKRNVGEMLMLAVSEIAEAMEGHRKNLPDDKLPHRPMIEVEIADCLIRLCDTAGALGLDLGGAMAEKMAFNATRPDHKPEARRAFGGKAY